MKEIPKYKINDLLHYQFGNNMAILEVRSINQHDNRELVYNFNLKKFHEGYEWCEPCLTFDKKWSKIISRVDYEAEEEIRKLLKLDYEAEEKIRYLLKLNPVKPTSLGSKHDITIRKRMVKDP